MSNKQILRALQERQITDLVTEIQKSQKYSPLKRTVAPMAANEIQQIKGWEEKMRHITGFETILGNYVDLLECCEKETGEHSHGYTQLRPYSGKNDEEWRARQEQRLEQLTRAGLVKPNGKTKWKYEVTEIRDANDKLHGSNTTPAETSKFYVITTCGAEELAQHRKIEAERK